MNEVSNVQKSYRYGLAAMAVLVVGLFAVGPASAATCPELKAGKVVRVPAKNAYYLVGEDGFLSKYLNLEACMTWRSDCLKGTKLSTTCLKEKTVNASELGYREGSRLIRYLGKYYGVGPNNTLYPIATNAAKSLYGASWKSLARPINKKMFAGYTLGEAVKANMPHEGMLVKKAKTNMVYKMEDGTLKLVEGKLPAYMKAMVRAMPAKLFDAVNSGNTESVKTETKVEVNGETKTETKTEVKTEVKTETKTEESKDSTDSSDGWSSYTSGLSAYGFSVYLPSTKGVSVSKGSKDSKLGAESYSILYSNSSGSAVSNIVNNIDRIDLSESSDPADLAYTPRAFAEAYYGAFKGALEGASVGAALPPITCAWPAPSYSDKTLGGNSWSVVSFMDGCTGGQFVYPVYKQFTYAFAKIGGKMVVVFFNNSNMDVRTTGTTSLDPAKAVNTTFVDTFLGKLKAK